MPTASSTAKNAYSFANNPFSQNAFQNAGTGAYGDLLRMWSEVKAPSFDMSNVADSCRRNVEAVSTANQVLAEGLQNASRRQAELTRNHIETVLRATKDLFGNGSPEINTKKHMELARSLFESSINNAREVSELVAKSSFQALDVINKRTAESLEELTSYAKAA